MRLDKLLSHAGYGSRRDVKELIKKKHVLVNDEVIRKVNIKVNPEKDVIIVGDKKVDYEEYVYLMLNKPDGYLSATVDKYDPVVIDLIEGYEHVDLFPVGRLDKDTEGLLLITNDGAINHKLTSPNYAIPKTYYAKINGVVTEEDIDQFSKGVILDDGYQTKPGILNILSSAEVSEIELTITEGKFHQVKRMFKSVEKEVIYLKRIQMGEIKLDNKLNLSEFRKLNETELNYLSSL